MESEFDLVNNWWLERNIREAAERGYFSGSDIMKGELKFVLLKDLDGNGYVRFCGRYESHRKMESLFSGFMYNSADPRREGFGPGITKRDDEMLAQNNRAGGGFVRIKDVVNEDESPPIRNIYHLVFYGKSETIGPFDKEILDKALREGLSKMFTYEIE